MERPERNRTKTSEVVMLEGQELCCRYRGASCFGPESPRDRVKLLIIDLKPGGYILGKENSTSERTTILAAYR